MSTKITAEERRLKRHKLSAELREAKGDRCKCCGFNSLKSALQFHHLDPSQKSGTVARLVTQLRVTRAREEAEKTVLVCANCHVAIHRGELSELFIWKSERKHERLR